MPQSTLNFASAKRTSSTAQLAKSKLSKSVVKAEAPKSPRKKLKRKSRNGDEETDNYVDIETPEISSDSDSDHITEVSPLVEEKEKKEKREDPVVEELESHTPKTRSQSKKGIPSVATSVGKKSNFSKSNKDASSTASPTPFKPSNLTSGDLAKKVEANAKDDDTPLDLDPKSAKWNKAYGAAREKMGDVAPIHAKQHNKVHDILRVFDNSHEYGPCVGMTRLDRWERADALGLHPPEEIYEILTTKQGLSQDEYKETVFIKEV